jgi:hypothetical protein
MPRVASGIQPYWLVRAGVGWKPGGVVGHTTVQTITDSSEGYAQTQHAVTSDDIATETRFVYPQFFKDKGSTRW